MNFKYINSLLNIYKLKIELYISIYFYLIIDY